MTRGGFLACLLLISMARAWEDVEWEDFPLSGGIGTGITVRVTAGIDHSEPDWLKMSFTLPDRTKLAFSWCLKLAEAKIERSAALNEVTTHVQDWGTMSFVDTSSISFDFLKAKHHWAVSVNGVSTPWFDFPVLTTLPITHLRIYKGFANPEVTFAKPACTTACSASECRDGEDGNSCTKDGEVLDVSNCFIRFPTDAQNTANCSTGTLTRQDGGNCCNGWPEAVDIATAAAGTWVHVMGDEDRVSRSCGAFSLSESGCKALVGRPVRIVEVNAVAKTLACWAPPSTPQTFPYFALSPHTPAINNVAVSRAEMNSLRENGINYNTRLISNNVGAMQRNWYVVAMHEKAGGGDADPWVPVIDDRWQYWCDQKDANGVQILIADVGTELIDYITDCTDLKVSDGGDWLDRDDRSCAYHRQRGWCTEAGEETNTYKNAHSRRKTFSENQNDGMYAPKACCGCGGGSLGGNLNTLPPVLSGRSVAQSVKALVK